MTATPVQIAALVIFVAALLHTFATDWFEHRATISTSHSGVWKMLAEVEIVFGFWALVLLLVMAAFEGGERTTAYIDSRRFTEPLFVFAIMVIAGSKPIIDFTAAIARGAATSVQTILPVSRSAGFYLVVLSIVPLLGSFITEPAAMTLAALLLRDHAFSPGTSKRLKYATLGVLFVNVSIGGTLTPFAAPPVLMVAHPWEWDLRFMMTTFGWRAAVAVFINAGALTMLMRRELTHVSVPAAEASQAPSGITFIHVALLAAVIKFSHHPAIFIGLFLLFLGFAHAYERYQSRLLLREGLLVAFFLAGLIVLGGQQEWWLQPLLTGANDPTIYFGATALTAVTDNAALTYLGTLATGLTASAKYALVAGAVTGGGLTVIANAPNPAGFSILKGNFEEGAIHPGGLFLAALAPTAVAIFAFWILP